MIRNKAVACFFWTVTMAGSHTPDLGLYFLAFYGAWRWRAAHLCVLHIAHGIVQRFAVQADIAAFATWRNMATDLLGHL
jgi:hypothetical protein